MNIEEVPVVPGKPGTEWQSLSKNLSNIEIEDPNLSDIERREMYRRMRAIKIAREKYKVAVPRDYYRKALEEEDRLGRVYPAIGMKLSPDKKSFNTKIFIDLRWGKFSWQKQMARNEINPRTKKRYKYSVSKLPRRHGKTYYGVFDGRDVLITCNSNAPIGAYYCPVKGQAVRNAWKVFETALLPVPGYYVNKSQNYMTFPRPTLTDPTDFVIIYFFGVVGGSGTKRGGYYNWVYFDEIEHISRKFVQEAGISSIFDRDGIMRLTGTPDGMGELGYCLDEAKKRETVVKTGKKSERYPDAEEWIRKEEDCWSLKVYSRDRLEKIRASMEEIAFKQEFECIDVIESQGFYHRMAVDSLEKMGGISPWIRPDTNLPLRAYFDLGLGSKSDRMAFIVCQLGQGYVNILWGQNVFEKGYAGAVAALAKVPVVFRMGVFEIVLPHDARSSEQSDAIQKVDKFEMEVRKQGFASAGIRVMERSSDKLMDIATTTETIPYFRIHSIDAMDVVEALRNHKKKYLRNEGIFVQEPAKTPFRDLADAVRIMAIDFKYDTFTKAQYHHGTWFDPTISPPIIESPRSIGGDLSVDVGFHPHAGSVIVGGRGRPPGTPTATKWTI